MQAHSAVEFPPPELSVCCTKQDTLFGTKWERRVTLPSLRISDLLKMGRAGDSKPREEWWKGEAIYLAVSSPFSTPQPAPRSLLSTVLSIPRTPGFLLLQPFRHSTTLICRLKQIKHAHSLCLHCTLLVLWPAAKFVCVCVPKLGGEMCRAEQTGPSHSDCGLPNWHQHLQKQPLTLPSLPYGLTFLKVS